MSNLNDRTKAFENKFAHDAELQFKARNRRNKLFGTWVAEELGLGEEQKDGYARSIIVADLEEEGDEDIFKKIQKDFEQHNKPYNDDHLRSLLIRAMDQVQNELS